MHNNLKKKKMYLFRENAVTKMFCFSKEVNA